MGNLFSDTPFNQPLNDWDVSNVTDMSRMFEDAAIFNQPLNAWDVSNVTQMENMFTRARYYNQTFEEWDVSSVEEMGGIFIATAVSTEHYDLTLEAWSTLNLSRDVKFSAGDSQYCLAEDARQRIIDNFNWEIRDSGKNCE